MENMFKNLLEHYAYDIVALVADYRNVGAYAMVSGGCFAISYYDQRAKLQACGYKVDHLDDSQVFELYCDTVVDVLDETVGLVF